MDNDEKRLSNALNEGTDNDISSLKKQMAELTSLVAQLVKKKVAKKPVKKKRAIKSPKKVSEKLDIEPVPVKRDTAHIISLVQKQESTKVRGSQKGRQCRTEPMNIPKVRPNLFIKSAIAKSCKNDTKTDRLLHADREPTERRPTAQLYEVKCTVCGNIDVVSENMIMADPDTGDITYTCDNCIRNK
jgi:hypothetical protein